MIRTVLHYLHGRFIHAMLKTQSQGLVPVRCRLLCILRKQTQKAQESTSGTLSLGYLDSQLNWVTSWCHAAPRWQRWRSLNIRPLYSVRELLGLPLTPNAKTCNDAVQSQWCEDFDASRFFRRENVRKTWFSYSCTSSRGLWHHGVEITCFYDYV